MVNQNEYSGYMLTFISGKYKGTEYLLNNQSAITIGRSSNLDLVLVEDMVSRRHAKITVDNGQIWIEDIGSTNGTFVNGDRVKRGDRRLLKEGDRILVGTSIILLKRADFDPREEEFYAEVDADAERDQFHTTEHSVLKGRLEEVALPDLLQLFAASKKTGCLLIKTNTHEGKIFLKNGRLVGATIDDELGVDMTKIFYRLMGWNKGTFTFDIAIQPNFEEDLNENIEGMMMEGMRLLDEIRNLGSDVPDYDAHMQIAVPLLPPLRELSQEMLDTLQLAHNYNKVETILNKSMASDLETLQDLVYLLRKEYLQIYQ